MSNKNKKRYICLIAIMLLQIIIGAKVYLQNTNTTKGTKSFSQSEIEKNDSNGVEWKDHKLTTKGDDPYIKMPGVDGYVKSITINLNKSVDDVVIAIYLDDGKGFTESNKLTVGITETTEISIPVYSRLNGFRLDFEDGFENETLEIENISVEYNKNFWHVYFVYVVFLVILVIVSLKRESGIYEIIIKYIAFLAMMHYAAGKIACSAGGSHYAILMAGTIFAAIIADYHSENKDRFFILLPIGCFFLYTYWALMHPFNGAPDESMRYTICKYVYDYNKLPHGGDPLIREPNWGVSYAFTPIVSYIISAILMKLFGFMVAAEKLYIIARMTSVLFSVGTVIVAGKISKLIFKEPYGKLFTVSVALFPQFMFISTYVNNDAMGIFSVAMIFYYMLLARKKEWDMPSCIKLGVAIGICLLSYYNCYPMIVIALGYSIYGVLKSKNIENKPKFILIRICWVIIPTFIVAGWWFIRNAIIYDGDILGMRTSRKYSDMYAIEGLKQKNRVTPYNLGESLSYFLFDRNWLDMCSKSFYAGFGNMNIFLKEHIYRVADIVIAVGFIGNIIKEKDTDKKQYDIIITAFALFVSAWALNIYYSYFCDYQPQGRYSLPMLVGFGILVINGWKNILQRSDKRVEKIGIAMFGMTMIVMGFYCSGMVLG